MEPAERIELAVSRHGVQLALPSGVEDGRTRIMRNEDYQTLEDDVLGALATHQRWRDLVRHARDISLATALTVPSIEECSIMGWLNERMPDELRALALYDRTQSAHRAFHAAVELVVDDRSDRSFPHAASLLKSCLEEWLTISRVR